MARFRPLGPCLAVLGLVSCSGSGPAGPAPPRPLSYVAIGASDAIGVGAFPLEEGYVYELRDRLAAAGFAVALTNTGRGGATLDEIVAEALPAALAAVPDVVTVWVGSNDLIGARDPDDFAAELDGLLAALSARGTGRVFVADLVDLTRAPIFQVRPDADVTATRVAAFNQRIRAAAAARGAVLVELSAMPLALGLFSIDGFHPSNEGHERIAARFWDAIRPLL